jgi:hypothetical protein
LIVVVLPAPFAPQAVDFPRSPPGSERRANFYLHNVC